jgi:hypothetical protein
MLASTSRPRKIAFSKSKEQVERGTTTAQPAPSAMTALGQLRTLLPRSCVGSSGADSGRSPAWVATDKLDLKEA